MEERRKGAIGLLLLFGIMMFVFGFTSVINRTNYDCPIYVSQETRLVDNVRGSKTLYVQLQNRADTSIEISQINFNLKGAGVSRNMPYCYHIFIKSGEAYDLEIEGIKTNFNKGSAVSCKIGEKAYMLKYSADGINFYKNSSSFTIYLLLIIGAILFFIIDICLFVGYIHKKNNIKY